MKLGTIFWVLMILVIIFGGYIGYSGGWSNSMGLTMLQFVLFFLLGWKVFGFVVQE